MKSTIAAGILVAQSLPVVSDDNAAVAAEILLAPRAGSTNHHDLDIPKEIASNVLQLPKLQRSKIQDTRITSMTQTSCNPFSDAPDVGVLSCGPGYECVPQESSTLGGICVSSSRELQAGENCYLCDYGQLVGYSKYNVPSGYQDFTCGDLAIAAYGDVAISSEQCDGAPPFVQSAGCCVSYDCNPCGNKTFIASALLSKNDYTCGDLTPLLNATFCASNTEYLSGICCEDGGAVTPTTAPASSPVATDTPTSVVPGSPTPAEVTETPTAAVPTAGVPTPTTEEVTDSPTAGVPASVVPGTPTTAEVAATTDAPATPDSATMWSTNTLVSAMGFASATAVGLLLN